MLQRRAALACPHPGRNQASEVGLPPRKSSLSMSFPFSRLSTSTPVNRYLEPHRASDRLMIPGPVAQLGERLVRNEEVVSSILIGSTRFLLCGGLRAAVLTHGTTSPISMSVVIPPIARMRAPNRLRLLEAGALHPDRVHQVSVFGRPRRPFLFGGTTSPIINVGRHPALCWLHDRTTPR